MKILATSDWHIDAVDDKKYGEVFNPDIIDEMIDAVERQNIDVFIFGGDLASDREAFSQGLKLMAKITAHKLFFAGNNCLKGLENNDWPHYARELQARLKPFDIHLLDQSPVVIKGIGFVGNCGWYDGTFWTPDMIPLTFEEMSARAQVFFTEDLGQSGAGGKLTFDQFFRLSWMKIIHDLDLMRQLKVRKVVLGIHHVPSRQFLLQKSDPEWQQTNFCMGSERYQELFGRPEVCLGLTGHTHRPEIHLIGGTPVVNISYSGQTPYRIITVDN